MSAYCSVSPVRDVTDVVPSGPAASAAATLHEALRQEEHAEAVAACDQVIEPVDQRAIEPSPSLAPKPLEAVVVERTLPVENVDIPAGSSSSAAQPGLSLVTGALREGVAVCGDVETVLKGLAEVRINTCLSMLRPT